MNIYRVEAHHCLYEVILVKGSEVRDYLVNISTLVQTPGAAAGLGTTRNNDKKSC